MKTDAPSLIPKARPAADLASRLAAAAVERRKAADAKKRELPKNSCWVLACPRDPASHVGILFAEGVDPTRDGEIHGGMWFSSYHDLDDAWFGGREQMVCSSCLAETGERTTLKVEMVQPSNPDAGSSFRVPAHWHRYLRVLGASDLEQFLGPAPSPEPPAKPAAPSASAKEAKP